MLLSLLFAVSAHAATAPALVCVDESRGAPDTYKVAGVAFSKVSVELPTLKSVEGFLGFGTWDTYRLRFSVNGEQVFIEFPNAYSPSTGTLTDANGTRSVVCSYRPAEVL